MNSLVAFKTAAKSNDPETLIPTLQSVSEPYRELFERRAAMWDRQNALQDERRDLYKRTDALGAATKTADERERASRIAKLVGDKPVSQQSKPSDGTRGRVAAVETELRDLKDALELIEFRLRQAANTASVAVCEAVKAEHERRARNLVKAVLAVHEANAEYTAFADVLERREISWAVLRPIYPQFLANPRATHGPVASFLFDAIDMGWLKPSDMPAEFCP